MQISGGRRRSAQGEGSLVGAAALTQGTGTLTQGPGMSTQTAGSGGLDAVGRGWGVDAKAGTQGWGAAQWDGAQTQGAGDAVGATESKREGKQTHPLAFGGFGGMEKKKKKPPPLASEGHEKLLSRA